MSKDKSRKHDRKGRVDTAEPRDALLACCDAAGLVGTSAAPREDSKKASRMAATAQAAAEAQATPIDAAVREVMGGGDAR